MDTTWIAFLISFTLLCSTSTASFLYGQPCSVRNTAHLYPWNWTIPKNATNCVDLTKSSNRNLANVTEFFRDVRLADTLYMDHMNLSRFPTAVIYSLPQLEMVDLSGNAIRRLPYRMYKIAHSITKLLVPENAIFIPRRRALFKSITIETLMLSKNEITNISPVTFAKMPQLKVLYLNDNKLKFVSYKMFVPLPHLLYLNLEDNYLSRIPQKSRMPAFLKFYQIKKQKKIK
ncbi:leucine-rich repeat-containing protein 15 [Dendroctonus ponderosae]|uniref:leucine-rich repeat-containing protein 15 n=1 Tax=Dendroctonus ponderosae TaxID=77166 RepID=UPI0020364528|nr:leucine-rich repeat-containing protein 15 [Dendroctonus ponderosae]KAH1010108.1 hypothetical protein HUJ05_004462 [Dendroctonus ponderosae]